MALRTLSLVSAVRCDGVPHRSSNSLPHLSISKPSWVVRTESNVRKTQRRMPDSPCEVCKGSGRVDCHHCQGRGRTNCVQLIMLPKGEWPKWCRTCGGSGLSYCSRCLGTGEYRDIMGFHFMKRGTDQSQDHKNSQVRDNPRPHSTADLLINEEQWK
ncbi:unnamed protein product, partial [Vitis vinifera]|eukprot:XP_002263419.1 PREDICTED: uncharacterized protein LOC100259890 [Vitis vinifera]